ncbi:hypothetical protein XH94_38085 [Bradyrhizobium zhanjiangense]|uniref:Uncharacterized protein n=1 Tax=Bradyrhizobium zhanjiangense TaxID=1325107 RepID=A0A4Q0RSM0_9BRAD|nr:hypothetical protein XH94_38085 [Bradyrhizobium zhanjiangense]
MLPLARFWTWVGHSFIPLAVGWAYFVRNGPDEGVLITRGYFGWALTLLVGAALTFALGRYISLAKARHLAIFIPPNTTFEATNNRNRMISWVTLVAFALFLIAANILFASRYADSRIHRWDSPTPLDQSFVGSRLKAHQASCSDRSCFAISKRVSGTGPVRDVMQYFPYYTDGLLILLAAAQLAALAYLAVVLSRPEPPFNYQL